jgi:serine/threonine-protein kinase
MIEKDTLSRTGMVIGTPSFMSPEQARGEVRGLDETLDVYGLGATFYALVTGKEPFSGQSLYEIITKVISEMPREPRMIKKEIPKEIEAIIMKAMAKEKHERYSNAKAIADDIERFLKGEPIRATKYSIIKGVTQRIKRYKNRILVAGIMVIVLLLTFMILRLGSELKKERRIHALLKETAHLINKFDTFLSSPNPFDITSKYYILDDAIKNAKDAIKLKENLSEGYYEVARALIRKNRIKDAIKWLNKAIRIEPKGTYYYERGKIYLRLYLDEIFGGTGTLTERVFSPCMRELKEKIENDLKMVRGLNKMESEISQAIFLFCTKDLKKALKILDTAEQELIRINDIKLLPEVYHLKALIRCNQKRYSDAIKLLKEAIRFQGNRELFYLNCARIYTVKALFLLFNKRSPEDDITQAITMSKIALKINPHDYLAYYQLGIIYLVKSMYLSSIGKEFMTELSYVIRNLKKSLELNPEYLYAYNLLISSIYRRAKNLILKEMDPLEVIACGIRYTEDALKLAPYDLSFYIYKARLYMLKGQWFLEKKKDYKKEFEIVVKILTDALVIQVGSPEDSRRAVIYKLRGDAYHKLGYKEEAKRDWQRAKKLAPGFEDPF